MWMIATLRVINHSVKSPANSTDTARLGRIDLQEMATK